MNFDLHEFRDLASSVCIQMEGWKGHKWWEENDNPALYNPFLSIYTREVEETDEKGINEPGTYQQTAIVLPNRVVVVTGKKIEILDLGAGLVEHFTPERDSDLPILESYPV